MIHWKSTETRATENSGVRHLSKPLKTSCSLIVHMFRKDIYSFCQYNNNMLGSINVFTWLRKQINTYREIVTLPMLTFVAFAFSFPHRIRLCTRLSAAEECKQMPCGKTRRNAFIWNTCTPFIVYRSQNSTKLHPLVLNSCCIAATWGKSPSQSCSKWQKSCFPSSIDTGSFKRPVFSLILHNTIK